MVFESKPREAGSLAGLRYHTIWSTQRFVCPCLYRTDRSIEAKKDHLCQQTNMATRPRDEFKAYPLRVNRSPVIRGSRASGCAYVRPGVPASHDERLGAGPLSPTRQEF